MHRPLRLQTSSEALIANFRTLERRSGAPCGAAVKANGYGIGARAVATTLLAAGCRDFFVSNWAEASALDFLPKGTLAVLHGLGPKDVLQPGVRPVLISIAQVSRWRSTAPAHATCDVMVDTGMNRLGLATDELDALDGLAIHTLHSHLARGDEDSPQNAIQLARFRQIRAEISAHRYSLANSAGVFLGTEFAFDLTRPGLALYGGIPRPEARGVIRPVVKLEASVVQRRRVPEGAPVGYNGTFVADRPIDVAVLNIGYADGYWRAFSGTGVASWQGHVLPVIGRVSMDLVTVDVSAVPIKEGDWVELNFDLEEAAGQTGLSQYELLTGLGNRFERLWS